MKLEIASFQIRDRRDVYLVTFQLNEVIVHRNGDEARRVSNVTRDYKPCMSHCLDLIRSTMNKPPQSNQAARRRERSEVRPLRVFSGDRKASR